MNHLKNETSPYLIQHVNNPVDWYPWGEEALQKAKNENKLIIVSIGYAACHWCHVMEHESFESKEVAKFMNKHFVSIKVDREERPDIDQVYMEAVQLMTGSGGWPLNAITLPDGRPIYGGTYFTKNKWLEMLSKVLNFATSNLEKAEEYAEKLTQGIQNDDKLIEIASQQNEFSKNDIKDIFHNWKSLINFEHGGNTGAPKFPLPSSINYLMQHHYFTKDEDALNAAITTLHKMASGGIYDQIGGGFARYSTDALWKVPHFEKMLYDNAQLITCYCNAYRITQNEGFRTVVYETLAFLERELYDKNTGAFYASLDADTENEEGTYYVWTKSEIESILNEDAQLIIDYFNITEEGNWENGKNVLFSTKKDGFDTKIDKKTLKNVKNKLLNEREKRTKPNLDDKILTSWNALTITGYIDAYRTFNESLFLEKAIKNAQFILKNLRGNDGHLHRNLKNNSATINGFLDDYANTIFAFINLYQATFNEFWIEEAKKLTEYTLEHFFDYKTGLFFYTSNLDPELIARKLELNDNVMPSSNAVMAKNLILLGHLLHQNNFIKISKNMLLSNKNNCIKHGAYYANWCKLALWSVSGISEIAIVGDNANEHRANLDQNYLPNSLFLGCKQHSNLELLQQKYIPNQTKIYVCKNKSCKQPVTNVQAALQQIN